MKTHPEPTDKHVGTRLRMRRLMLEMSQTELATALGITFQQIQKYEKGTNRISASRLQQISEILQVTAPFFFEGLPGIANKAGGKIEQAAPKEYFRFLATAEGLSLAKAFVQIDEKRIRRAIVRLVEEIGSSNQ